MCTHNLCFVQELGIYKFFSLQNYHLYSREKLQYTTKACYHNGTTRKYMYEVKNSFRDQHDAHKSFSVNQ